MRSTVSCVQLISRPSAMASSTICLPGMARSMPSIRPKPRTSLDELEFPGQGLQPLVRSRRPTRWMEGEQLIEDVQKFERRAARQRAAAEGAAVHSGLDSGRGFFVGHDDAKRNAAGERLGRHHDIGQNDRRSSADRRNRFRGVRRRTGFHRPPGRRCGDGQFARLGGEFGGDRMNAAFALNHFQNYAGRAFAERGIEGG